MDVIKCGGDSRVVQNFIGLVFCGVFFVTGCSARLFEKPMFYDEEKNPIYIEDIFEAPEQRKLGSEIIDGDIKKVESLSRKIEDLSFKGLYGITPLWLAVDCNHMDIVLYLIENGASPSVEVEWVSSIVGTAAEKNPMILKVLIEAGASLTQESGGFDGLLPIHHAARSDFPESVSLLVDAGVDVNVRSKSGAPPVLMAAAAKKLDNVILLLEAGADPWITNAYGGTVVEILDRVPLNESKRKKAEEIKRLIGIKSPANKLPNQ